MMTQPQPMKAMKTPPIPGPSRRAALKLAELRLIALGSRSMPTTSLTKAWRAGPSKAIAMPCRKLRARISHSFIRPVIVSSAIDSADTRVIALATIRIVRLGSLSATVPTKGVSSSPGRKIAAVW